LNEQTFRANEWLDPVFSQGTEPGVRENYPLANAGVGTAKTGFSPKKFLIPGWTGDSLGSKTAYAIKSHSEELWRFALKYFNSFEDCNKTLKNSIYLEFLDFAKSKNVTNHEFSSYVEFWPHLFSPASPYAKEIKEFKNIYCYRAVIVYLYRLQFVLLLGKVANIPLKKGHYLNPSSFITKVFPKGSSKELICESLQSNRYSWFMPKDSFNKTILELAEHFQNISCIEFLKIFSHVPGIKFLPKFSHTLSHKCFGDFLNQLLNKIPQWLNMGRSRSDVINTKFSGDFLESLTNSFWLGQKETDTIISPDFIGEGFDKGPFLKICQEIQFLTSLLNHARKKNLPPVEFLSTCMKEKYSQTCEDGFGQMKLFDPGHIKGELLYSRIFLNLVNFPKKNPHHHLVNQINAQLKTLKRDGLLFVFSNQNLFVPSQGERVSTLLQDFKMNIYFNFENLKGKGEITSYLYVLSKRLPGKKERPLTSGSERKESCLFFRWSGDLSSFYNFSEFTTELQNYLSRQEAFSNSIYHKELHQGLSFEFHHDAILNGKLLHSSSQDTSKITHPSFFKNLTKFCTPLDNFFMIESLNPGNRQDKAEPDYTLELLGYRGRHEDKFPFILIADHSNPDKIDLEIIPSSSYKAKVEEYGYACFHYFGLIPKKLNLNVNIFREYFLTDIGQQIIQLSLDGLTKLKSKLQALLVPKFFIPLNQANLELHENFNFLKSDSDELLNLHPEFLNNSFNLFKDNLAEYTKKHPLEILDAIVQFKLTIQQCLRSNHLVNSGSAYQNPIIQEKLEGLTLRPIINNNDNIHVEPLTNKKENLHLPLTHTQIKQKGENWYLELSSNGIKVFRLYSDPTLLNFISFLLGSVVGLPIAKILMILSVPEVDDLKEVLDNFNDVESCLHSLYQDTATMISKLITQQVASLPLSN